MILSGGCVYKKHQASTRRRKEATILCSLKLADPRALSRYLEQHVNQACGHAPPAASLRGSKKGEAAVAADRGEQPPSQLTVASSRRRS